MVLDLGARRPGHRRHGGRGGTVLISRLAAAALALALAAGCVYSPEGSCEADADCAAGERCSAGVCTPLASPGPEVGVDPTSFTSVTWSALAGAAGVSFAVDSVGADPVTGDVVVAGAVDSPFDFGPSPVGTGAFVLSRAGADGAARWATSLPTFVHGRIASAVLPGGDVLFAGTAADPTTIVTLLPAPAPGALVVGGLDALDGHLLWARGFDGTHPTDELVPVAVSASGADVLVAGTGSADLGCGDTAADAFVASLSAADGSCRWSLGLDTRTLSDVEACDDGKVAVAGLCTPSGAYFDPGGGTTCTAGMFVAVLSADGTATAWARTSSGGTVTAVRDLAVAPDGRVTVVGDARGAVSFGGAAVDFGAADGSFAAGFGPTGTPAGVVRPVEAPLAEDRDELAFRRGAYDRAGRLWIAGTYLGQPTLGGIRFSACRAPTCGAAAFLARLEADGAVSSFLPLRAAPGADERAFVDDLALFVTTGTVAHALRLTGTSSDTGAAWTSAGDDLAVLRAVP